MKPDELIAMGCKAWTYNHRQELTEYYLPIGDGVSGVSTGDIPEERLTVDERKGEIETVWIILRHSVLKLKHIKTMDQFRQLYALLTGIEPLNGE